MNELGNTVEDLFLAEELKEYTSRVYPFNLDILHMALKAKLEKDPDYEVWVPLIYYRSVADVHKEDTPTLLTPYKTFISNKGKVVWLGEPGLAPNHQWRNNGYWITRVKAPKGDHGLIRVHRALACSFIPPAPELGAVHPKDLPVNHINGIKDDYALTNLEWTTPSGNSKHAHVTGLAIAAAGEKNSRTKAAVGEILRGQYAGVRFILSGRKEQLAAGFIQSSINRCCLGIIGEHKHCAWSFATKEEMETLPRGLSEEVLTHLLSMKPLPKRPSKNGIVRRLPT